MMKLSLLLLSAAFAHISGSTHLVADSADPECACRATVPHVSFSPPPDEISYTPNVTTLLCVPTSNGTCTEQCLSANGCSYILVFDIWFPVLNGPGPYTTSNGTSSFTVGDQDIVSEVSYVTTECSTLSYYKVDFTDANNFKFATLVCELRCRKCAVPQ